MVFILKKKYNYDSLNCKLYLLNGFIYIYLKIKRITLNDFLMTIISVSSLFGC